MRNSSAPVTRIAILAALFFFAVARLLSYPTGISGKTLTGCTCHGSSDGMVTFSISGPPSLARNATGTYTLTINGGSGSAMGVDITVSAGTLALVTTTNLQLSGNEITHTARLTSRTVQFNVTAPASGGSLTINYAGVSDFANWGMGSTNQPLPMQLASFTVTMLSGDAAKLDWTTMSEVNNYGFRVQRRSSGSTEFEYLPGAFVDGHGTTSVLQQYSYTDMTAGPGAWYYRLAQVNLDGTVNFTEAVGMTTTGVTPGAAPAAFALQQNYPNPFNPSTTIRYGLPRSAFVTLTVYNALGQEVATLVNENQEAGNREVMFDANGLASGTYFYRLRAGSFVQSREFVYLR